MKSSKYRRWEEELSYRLILPTPLLFIVSHEYLVVQLIEFRVDSLHISRQIEKILHDFFV